MVEFSTPVKRTLADGAERYSFSGMVSSWDTVGEMAAERQYGYEMSDEGFAVLAAAIGSYPSPFLGDCQADLYAILLGRISYLEDVINAWRADQGHPPRFPAEFPLEVD